MVVRAGYPVSAGTTGPLRALMILRQKQVAERIRKPTLKVRHGRWNLKGPRREGWRSEISSHSYERIRTRVGRAELIAG